MERIEFRPTEDSPKVILDKVKSEFLISGNSFSDDPFTVYGRIFSWLDEYGQDPNTETLFKFKLNYINTASSKQIAEILNKLTRFNEKTNVKVNWYYDEDDEDTLIEGKELQQIFKLDFDFIPYETEF